MFQNIKLSTKLLLTQISLLLVVLLALSSLTLFVVSNSLYNDLDRNLYNMINGLSKIPKDYLIEDFTSSYSLPSNENIIKGEYYLALTDKYGNIINEKFPALEIFKNESTIDIFAPPIINQKDFTGSITYMTEKSDTSYYPKKDILDQYRAHPLINDNIMFEVKNNEWRVVGAKLENSDRTIYVAASLDDYYKNIDLFIIILILASFMIIFVSIIISRLSIKRNLQDLENIKDQASKLAKINFHDIDHIDYIPMTRPETTEVGSLQQSLNTLLEELINALHQMNEEQQITKTFISNSSHDLRTPVAIIRGYVDLYKSGIVTKDNIDELMSKIGNSTERLTKLVENILTLSRIDEGKQVEFSKFDIVNVLKTCKSDLEALNKDRNVGLISEENHILINSDKEKLENVFNNLIGNIVKYSSKDSPVEIKVSHYYEEGKTGILIQFIDHGQGVPDDHLGTIFNRFTVVDDSRATSTSGSGLGLSIVKATMELLNGNVWASKTHRGGLTVNLVLYN